MGTFTHEVTCQVDDNDARLCGLGCCGLDHHTTDTYCAFFGGVLLEHRSWRCDACIEAEKVRRRKEQNRDGQKA
jgi:hypothetical protein